MSETDGTEKSRIAQVAEQVANGEKPDWNRLLLLQALDMLRLSESFVTETIAREREADEQFRDALARIHGPPSAG